MNIVDQNATLTDMQIAPKGYSLFELAQAHSANLSEAMPIGAMCTHGNLLLKCTLAEWENILGLL